MGSLLLSVPGDQAPARPLAASALLVGQLLICTKAEEGFAEEGRDLQFPSESQAISLPLPGSPGSRLVLSVSPVPPVFLFCFVLRQKVNQGG